MSLRIPWDKYEAAILPDGWLKIKEGIPRGEVVTLVSYQLRQKAINQGLSLIALFATQMVLTFSL